MVQWSGLHVPLKGALSSIPGGGSEIPYDLRGWGKKKSSNNNKDQKLSFLHIR